MFEFILFVFFVLPIVLVCLFSFITGFNGYKKDNGYSEFVNSARWTDNR